MSKVRFVDNVGVSAFGNLDSGVLQTGSLLLTASAANNIITFTKGDTSQFNITIDTGSGGFFNTSSLLITASVVGNTMTFTKGDGSTFDVALPGGSGLGFPFSGSAEITGSLGVTGSISVSGSVINQLTASQAQFVPFNGNRPISNQDQPEGIKNVNFSASGLTDFINKVYFTNTPPEIITSNFTIGEFEASGSLVGVITASDAESGSQTLSYQTASSYIDDQFRISSSGDFGYLNLNIKSTSSMNTFNSGGIDTAPLPIVVTDSFGEATEKTIYIRITPNTAPIWSSSPAVGNSSEITSSLSESSAIGNNKDQYYYRDTESDTIFIGSGSYLPSEPLFSDYFSLDIITGVNPYVRLNQTAAPLDYDTYASYSFVLTASDQHYQDGDDPNSISYLPVQIEIVDNIGPSIDPQILTGINESGSAGDATSSPIVATDPEGFSLFLTEFTLLRAFKNGVNTNITSSLSASSTNLFTASLDPFQAATTQPFNVTRKVGQFLNVDIADRYVYRATVRDDYNPISQSAEITVEVANHVANTITTSSVFNIIESAITNERVKQTSTGIGGSDSTAEAANSSIQRWTVVSTPDFIEPVNATGSITQFQLKSNLSGSATVGGNTITIQVTASQDNFETTVQTFEKTIDVELLVAPSLVTASINSGNNLNTNGARPGGQNLFKINIDDGQPVGSKYDIDHSTWTFTPNAGQNLVAYRDTTVTGTSGSYYVSASANLAAGNYGFTANVQNVKGFRAGTLLGNFEILQAGSGTLTGDNPSYIIESSEGTAQIKAADDGYTGAQADLDVSYGLTGYNGAAVQSYTSSNALIAVTNTGLLSTTGDISGSYVSGNTITSTITFRDQYDNIGTGTATINVTNDVAPTVVYNITNNLLTASIANNGVTIGTVTANDAQGFNVTDVTLGGADAGSFNLVETTTPPASNRVFNIQPSTNLSAATYNITVTAKDSYGQETTEAQALPVVVYPDIPEVFVYISSRGNSSNFASSTVSINPPQTDGVYYLNDALGTAGQVDRPFGLWKAGRLGDDGNITTTGTNNMRMVVSASAGLSGTSLNSILSSNTFNALANGKSGNAVFILYPSSSDARLTGIPSSIAESYDPGNPVVGQYVVEYANPNSADDKGVTGAIISASIPSYVLDLDGAGFTASNGTIINDGDAGYYRYWSVLTPTLNPWSQTTLKFYVTPQSGSSPN